MNEQNMTSVTNETPHVGDEIDIREFWRII